MRCVQVAAVLGVLVTAGCASLRPPAGEAGPTLVIHNEGHRLLDLSYRCVENGSVQRLGSIAPFTSETFTLRTATCPTVYLVSHHARGTVHQDQRAVAVMPMYDPNLLELVFAETGFIMRKAPVTR